MAQTSASGIATVATAIRKRTPLNRQQIIGFWAAWFGWMLDGMDSVIYALVLGPALTELLPRSGMEATPANIGYVGSLMFGLFLVFGKQAGHHGVFWALVAAYQPGKTEAEIMAPAVERFFARGAGARMMNILLSGSHGEAEAAFKVPGNRIVAADDLLLYSLEVTGAGGYWVEFSRPLTRGKISSRTQAMADAYPEALESARKMMRAGELASHVHHAVADKFAKHGFALGHLSGHSIGTTMLEYPAIGAKSAVVLEENMIFSLHPQVVDQDGKVCLYTQDTYRIGKTEGECLADVPWKFFTGGETRLRAASQAGRGDV